MLSCKYDIFNLYYRIIKNNLLKPDYFINDFFKDYFEYGDFQIYTAYGTNEKINLFIKAKYKKDQHVLVYINLLKKELYIDRRKLIPNVYKETNYIKKHLKKYFIPRFRMYFLKTLYKKI